MTSAAADLDRVVHCTELGAEDYLPKPFTLVLPRARIGACLDRKRLHDREAGHLAEIEVQRRHADELLHALLPGAAMGELR
jgi:DNA-binding response OmpR family regulator